MSTVDVSRIPEMIIGMQNALRATAERDKHRFRDRIAAAVVGIADGSYRLCRGNRDKTLDWANYLNKCSEVLKALDFAVTTLAVNSLQYQSRRGHGRLRSWNSSPSRRRLSARWRAATPRIAIRLDDPRRTRSAPAVESGIRRNQRGDRQGCSRTRGLTAGSPG